MLHNIDHQLQKVLQSPPSDIGKVFIITCKKRSVQKYTKSSVRQTILAFDNVEHFLDRTPTVSPTLSVSSLTTSTKRETITQTTSLSPCSDMRSITYSISSAIVKVLILTSKVSSNDIYLTEAGGPSRRRQTSSHT